jgi:transcriptional regulator with XRE-family HTH domain
VAGLMKKRKVSLRELAKRLGVSPTYLSQVGTGKTVPSPKLELALYRELTKGK